MYIAKLSKFSAAACCMGMSTFSPSHPNWTRYVGPSPLTFPGTPGTWTLPFPSYTGHVSSSPFSHCTRHVVHFSCTELGYTGTGAPDLSSAPWTQAHSLLCHGLLWHHGVCHTAPCPPLPTVEKEIEMGARGNPEPPSERTMGREAVW